MTTFMVYLNHDFTGVARTFLEPDPRWCNIISREGDEDHNEYLVLHLDLLQDQQFTGRTFTGTVLLIREPVTRAYRFGPPRSLG